MNSLLVALIAFLATIILIVLLRPVAILIGLTDKPNARKQHVGSIPLIGGIAIYMAFGAAVLVSPWVSPAAAPVSDKLFVFLYCALILVVAGAWDDLRGLSPVTRMIVQIFVAFIMISDAGIIIIDLGAYIPEFDHVILETMAVPFTVFATVGLINAINMSDGLDGLSGNMTLISFVGLGTANAMWGSGSNLELLNVLSAAIAGFLVFNQRMLWRPTAAVFLGDAGSMLLGFALAWVAIEVSQGSARALTPAATLWFLIVPVYDTLGVTVRRLLDRRSPFQADAQHLHHLFVRAGFSVTATIASLCILALMGVVVGLFVTWWGVPDWQVMGAFVMGWFVYLAVIHRAWQRKHFLGRAVA
ncbi:MAG: undecaprenyl/decaprenyl-phosphate alpha-N-acetylglucosaminyl 1-phosphate transferase [Gammaproteobacteria bacterium]|nr:MAG: undecaprenyl/decaprenyl-phosphate alpha-N-acetylglucosaminyl 1-phosphate transferase [Gammaproteobacteria bacterium]